MPVECCERNKEMAVTGLFQDLRFAVPAFQMITPDFFKSFGIQMVKGRSFTEQDIDGSPRVAMVNENFVRKFCRESIRLESVCSSNS